VRMSAAAGDRFEGVALGAEKGVGGGDGVGAGLDDALMAAAYMGCFPGRPVSAGK